MTDSQQPWLQGARPEDQGADERLTRSGAPEVRGDNSIRQDAERQDMPLMTDAEYEAMVAAEYDESTLATPPAIPGYDLCWLTTTSQFDTIQKRQRVGYSPVMRSEVPGFDPSNGQNLQGYEGVVTCNEMVLHKILTQRRRVFMTLYHHKKPLAMESAILKDLEASGAKQADSSPSEPGGIDVLERSVKVGESIRNPTFS